MSARKELELLIEHHLEPEDIPFEGNVMASGNEAWDREQEQWVRDQLNSGNEAAWCQVRVIATFVLNPTGEELSESFDSLGGCSYNSERELWLDLGPDMRENATQEALTQLLQYIHGPDGHRSAPHGATWLRAVHRALSRWLNRHPHWAVYADRWLEEHP